jgi:hypothetical protein
MLQRNSDESSRSDDQISDPVEDDTEFPRHPGDDVKPMPKPDPEPVEGCPDVYPPLPGCGDDDEDEKPLQYCDMPEVKAAEVCHDRDDYNDDTGLYPCNDRSEVTDPAKCPPLFPHPSFPQISVLILFPNPGPYLGISDFIC